MQSLAQALPRVVSIMRSHEWKLELLRGRVVLDAGDRNRRRIVLEGERGVRPAASVRKT
jgi:hypothetical protein